jgi:hypothetical protein
MQIIKILDFFCYLLRFTLGPIIKWPRISASHVKTLVRVPLGPLWGAIDTAIHAFYFRRKSTEWALVQRFLMHLESNRLRQNQKRAEMPYLDLNKHD